MKIIRTKEKRVLFKNIFAQVSVCIYRRVLHLIPFSMSILIAHVANLLATSKLIYSQIPDPYMVLYFFLVFCE
jgi:hypothetical protein